MTRYTLPAESYTGPVHLTVSDLPRALAFYRDVLGLAVQEQEGPLAVLGTTDKPLVLLTEVRGARPKPRRSTGLYHVALLYPSRAALAGALHRLIEARYPLQGASDHLVSEALYLADPDGNGIELYRDRPRHEWPYRNGQLAMDTLPLDLESLLAEIGASEGLDGLTVGHVHLHVANLAEAERFYREALGLEVMVRYGGSASFLAAGGYHHHLGLNTWAGVGAPPPPADSVGLRTWTLLLPDEAALAALRAHLAARGDPFEERDGALLLRDPSQNRVALLTDAAGQRLAALDAGQRTA